MGKHRILVVDDSEDVREFLQMLLEGEGYQVSSVADGQACLDAVRASRPDLIVTDVSMPRMSGLEMLTHLRSDFAPPLPPVIVTSGFDESERSAMNLGAACFVPKPVEPAAFLEIVSEVLEQRPPDANAIAGGNIFAHRARARASEAAGRLLTWVKSNAPSFDQALARSAVWVAAYFNIAPAVIVVVEGPHVKVHSVSKGSVIPAGMILPGDLLFSTGVLAGESSLVLPDVHALGHAGTRRASEVGISFVVAVPLLYDGTPVGALGLIGREPRGLAAEDLLSLEGIGRSASTRLGHRTLPVDTIGLLPSALLDQMLSDELSLLHRDGGGLDFALVDTEHAALESGLPADLTVEHGPRLAVGRCSDGTLAIYKRDAEAHVTTQEMSAALAKLAAIGGLRAVGWVSIVDEHLPQLPADVLWQLARRALDDARANPSMPVSRVVVGHQSYPLVLEHHDA
jgi:CheY-like chemotaxis protein